MADQKTGLVITAHPGDFVWRAGGAIALHRQARLPGQDRLPLIWRSAARANSPGKSTGATLEKVKAGRRDEAERAAKLLGAEIEFFDCGDYPLKLNDTHFDRMVDIYRELNPAFVLTHALEDPYNFDHPNAAHFAQETARRGAGHGSQARCQIQIFGAARVPVRAAPAGNVRNYKPNLILKIDEVWEQKYRAFQILAAQKHLWAYYERVALNRGIQGSRNTGVPMTYGEAYQRLFPTVEEILK